MALLRQLLSFGTVGILASLTHVLTAWMLIAAIGWNPYAANLLGACAAFAVSFFGNAGFTFRTDRSLWNCACRYLCVSLFSLMTTSAILALVQINGLPTYIYVLAVLASVPPTTFVLARFWAFRRVGEAASYAAQPHIDV